MEPVIGVYGRVRDVLEQFLAQRMVNVVGETAQEPHEHHEDEALHRIEKELEYIRKVLGDLAERVAALEKRLSE